MMKNPRPKVEKGIHFHGCSLGEINALKPFINHYKSSEGVTITASTNTGFQSAKTIKGVEARYLPFETLVPFWLREQKLLIVAEAELWFLLFYWAKRGGAKTVLLSGRISSRSFPKYKRFSWFYRRLFKHIDLFLVQSEADKKRFEELGAENLKVSGNIKLLSPHLPEEFLDLPKSREVIVGASTHCGEEEIILNAFLQYGEGRLIIVPRHPERFDEVFRLIENSVKNRAVTLSKYSEDRSFQSDITLFDVMGKLTQLYRESDTVILGGSLVDGIGGHNPVEPASFNNRIVSGEFYFNQIELYSYIENLVVTESSKLLEALKMDKKVARYSDNLDFDGSLEEIDSTLFDKIQN
jgi:3-deoxy-D-manno-octulosonic-acid transferase